MALEPYRFDATFHQSPLHALTALGVRFFDNAQAGLAQLAMDGLDA